MNRITTHVLDAVLGKPAAGMSVRLDKMVEKVWFHIREGTTDADGRCSDLLPEAEVGFYRLTFNTRGYLAGMGRTSVFPEISITFTCDGVAHYRLPLLLSDNCYTTYRGS